MATVNTSNTQPANPCANCVHFTPAAACDIWQRATGETEITTETLATCKMAGWKEAKLPRLISPYGNQGTGYYAEILERLL